MSKARPTSPASVWTRTVAGCRPGAGDVAGVRAQADVAGQVVDLDVARVAVHPHVDVEGHLDDEVRAAAVAQRLRRAVAAQHERLAPAPGGHPRLAEQPAALAADPHARLGRADEADVAGVGVQDDLADARAERLHAGLLLREGLGRGEAQRAHRPSGRRRPGG